MPDVKLGRILPPRLKIVTPESGAADMAEAMIEAEATDEGGGVANLALSTTTPACSRGTKPLRGQDRPQDVRGRSHPGRNRLRISASNADGSWEAEPAEVVLTYERPLAMSQLYVMAVGISRYADAHLNLNYAARDAEAVADLFQRRGQGLYEKVHVTPLLDAQATRAGIHATLRALASQTRPQDTLVLFLAGHGTRAATYYFVPHDLRRHANDLETDIREQAIPADEFYDEMATARALKRMLIFDTCTRAAPWP